MKIEELRRLLKKRNLEAFLFSSPPNVFYLTGFKSTHAYAVVTLKSLYLLTDGRYYEKAKRQLKSWEVILIKENTFKTVRTLLVSQKIRCAGYESDRVSCEFRKKLKGVKWIDFPAFLENLRAIKTAEEIEIIKEGCKKTDEVYKKLLNKINPGMEEREVRTQIVNLIFKTGAEGESFPAIVASGKNSSVPHWETSTDKVKSNAPLLIDMGLLWKGYCTDFTRTIYLGKPTSEFKRIYTVVKDAHLYALEKVKAGNRIGDIDKAARSYISSKGFGKYFTHSTGHGIGIEIHEYPRIHFKDKSAKRRIEEGMVFTVEPGIYIPGKFGVRLENTVAVLKGIGEPLSEIPLDLICL